MLALNTSTRIYNFYILSIITFLIWKPSPTAVIGESLGYKIGDLLLFLIVVCVFIITKKASIPNNFNFFFLICFMLIEILSLFLSSLKLPIILDDIFELFRPALYLLIYLLIYSLTNSEIFNEKNIRRVRISLFLFFLISFFQLINFLGVKNVMSFFYELSKSRTLDTSETIWRLASTFTNPNYFAFFLSITFGFFFSGFLMTSKNKEKLVLLIFTSVSFIFVLFTGSRTGLLTTVLSLVSIYFVYVQRNYKNKMGGTVFSIVIFIGITTISIIYFEDFFNKFERFSNFENIKYNLYLRYEIWFDALNQWKENPLLGNGPYKYFMDTFDSNYVLVLYRYGLIGIVVFILFFAFNLTKSLKHSSNIFSLGMVGLNIVFLVSMISAIPYNFIQLGAIYICLVAIQDKLIYIEKKDGTTIE